jgi:hypothetical protein
MSEGKQCYVGQIKNMSLKTTGVKFKNSKDK